MLILAIDPGNTYSAYCFIDSCTLKPIRFGKVLNPQVCSIIVSTSNIDKVVIEMVQSFGMPVGIEVFDTVRWIGRFDEITRFRMNAYPETIFRKEEKQHICHSTKANDATIRRALIDRFANHDLKYGKGTQKNPDWFYGFKADVWAAYAVGLTYIETKLNKGDNNK